MLYHYCFSYYFIQQVGTREELLSVIGIPATWCNLFGKYSDNYATNLFLSITGYMRRSSAWITLFFFYSKLKFWDWYWWSKISTSKFCFLSFDPGKEMASVKREPNRGHNFFHYMFSALTNYFNLDTGTRFSCMQNWVFARSRQYHEFLLQATKLRIL